MIEVHGLCKVYGQKTAVKNLRLRVEKGDVFGFLGPNGAGKSTTIRMLTTIIRPTSGTALINGFDILRQPVDVRRQIAVIPQVSTLGVHLDVYQNILIYLLFRGHGYREARKRTDTAIERFGLQAVAHLRPHQLSVGFRRRVQVARALVSGARVLFLDEPSVGLDPVIRQETWNSITEARNMGVTIFLTTQVMEEAEALCNRVGLLFNGELVIDSPLNKLKARLGITRIEMSVAGLSAQAMEALLRKWRDDHLIVEGVQNLPRVTVLVRGDRAPLPEFIQSTLSWGGRLTRVDVRPPSLEDIYLHVVKGGKA